MDFAIDCKSVEENDLGTKYLSGELDPQAAEAFEQHYLGCERCWTAVRTMSEIRGALGQPPIVPVEVPPVLSRWTLLAAAAAVALAAAGVWQFTNLRSSSAPAPVMRGQASETLAVRTSTLPGGQLQLTWRPYDHAQSYRVEILRSDGIRVWKRETNQTRVIFDSGTLSSSPVGVSFLARVEAVDPMGQVVASGTSAPLPKP